MKSQKKIPTSKVQRASKFLKTGVKVGRNYAKHYTKKMFNKNVTKDKLHEDNARDIYKSLSQLKGSALKVAQMLSMDKNMLPKAYTEKFSMSQYSAPPLSGPLVIKTFQKYFGKSPNDLFDKFQMEAVNAASIGQVHLAHKDGKKLAVKIQYPGVANSIKSDLKMVKPFATRILQLPSKDIDDYMQEVEGKLLEETDYDLELKRSMEITEACEKAELKDLVFTKYYPEYSCQRILTMEWLDGMHLKEFLDTNPSQEVRNRIGQAMWDFYDFQMHTTKAVHADPHPGNFLMRQDGTLGIIDFGCIKEIPEDFYNDYFIVINPYLLENEELMLKTFYNMNYLFEEDTPEEVEFFVSMFKKMIGLLCKPFRYETFDFSDDAYFEEIFAFGEEMAKMEELRKSKKARGSRHALYINRTYFGLYTLLSDLKANINITRPQWLNEPLTSEA